MSDEARAKELFLDVLDEPPEARSAFLRSACEDDPELYGRVERLLEAHAAAERRLTMLRAPQLHPGSRLGPYRLIEPLGEGGFGIVWRARQDEPVRRDVALKVLRAGAEEGQALARFALERQVLASLTHPGIAAVHEGGTTDGRPWFAMELVDGRSITEHVERAGCSLRERLALFLDVCRAIRHAHQRGVIHRDVKPSNVLVHEVDGQPRVKVIDFGIAQVGAELRGDWSRQTLAGQLLGTPGTMSPEQLSDTRDVDTRSDVYSLGVLLYELLTGVEPFEHGWLREKGPSEALRILREDDPPRPSARALERGDARRARELRGELDWIVLRCLEKDRERRYSSVGELIADVERFQSGEPVQAGPPGTLYRARRFARRHALGIGALAAVLLALAIGATLALLEARRARRAERAEALAARQAELEVERFQSIAEFLEHVLLSLDPAETGGRDVSLLREVLDRAATGIADRGDRPPVVEASLRRVIGGAYAAIARFEPALEQLERALELRRAALGPDAPETIASEAELAGVLLHAGHFGRADPMLRELLARARRVLGLEHERTLAILGNYATLATNLGRHQEAIELLEELERKRIDELGAEHEATLLVTNNLALALGNAGRPQESLERLAGVMEVQVSRHGERHPLALKAISNYATALLDVGRYEEGEALSRLVLQHKLELYGPSHPGVDVTRNNLSTLLARLGRHEEALALLEEALENAAEGTVQRAKLLINASDRLRDLGRLDEAADRALASWRAAEASATPGSTVLETCENKMLLALLDAGRAAEAEPIARALSERASADPKTHPETRAVARLRLGIALAALARAEEARAELEAGLAAAIPGSEWTHRAQAALERLADRAPER